MSDNKKDLSPLMAALKAQQSPSVLTQEDHKSIKEAAAEAVVVVSEPPMHAAIAPKMETPEHPWLQFHPEGPRSRGIEIRLNDYDLELWRWLTAQPEVNPANHSTRQIGADWFSKALRKEASKILRARDKARKEAQKNG